MTRDDAFQVIEDALTIVSNRGMAREMALAKTALATLKSGNATPGTAWGCEAGWQPIESAPKDGNRILLGGWSATTHPSWLTDVCHWEDNPECPEHSDNEGAWAGWSWYIAEPTHWVRPIPPPPVTDKGAVATTKSPPAKATTEEDPALEVTDQVEDLTDEEWQEIL